MKKKQTQNRLAWDGFGTLEVIIIIAVLITVALLFRENIITFALALSAKVSATPGKDGLRSGSELCGPNKQTFPPSGASHTNASTVPGTP